jgi:hypothetical protein
MSANQVLKAVSTKLKPLSAAGVNSPSDGGFEFFLFGVVRLVGRQSMFCWWGDGSRRCGFRGNTVRMHVFANRFVAFLF